MADFMLGTLNVGCWTARKKDKKSAEKIESEAHAKRGTTNATKNLMVDVAEYEKVSKYATAFRVWWGVRAMPWDPGKGGRRAVHSDFVMPTKDEIAERASVYLDELVPKFIEHYAKTWPQRVYDMGALFDSREFPDPRDMKRRFYVSSHWETPPRAGDIRINMGNNLTPEELAAMVEDAKLAEQARIQNVLNGAAQRLYKVVKSLHEKMLIPIGEKGEGFHASKLENIAQMAELIPAFNITNDPKLAELAKLAHKLSIKSPDELKQDVDKRKRAADESKAVADAIASAFDVTGDDEE